MAWLIRKGIIQPPPPPPPSAFVYQVEDGGVLSAPDISNEFTLEQVERRLVRMLRDGDEGSEQYHVLLRQWMSLRKQLSLGD